MHIIVYTGDNYSADRDRPTPSTKDVVKYCVHVPVFSRGLIDSTVGPPNVVQNKLPVQVTRLVNKWGASC